MPTSASREHLRLLPAISAVTVATALGAYLIGSPVGSRQLSTVTLAGVFVGATIVSAASIVTGREGVATAIGLLFFPAGLVGFALGPQLWIIGSLILLSTTLDRSYVPYALLLFVGGLLALTVLTASGYRAVAAGLAVVVFAAAAYSTLTVRRRVAPT
ncbi:hypothetical protein M0R88_06080 [Halorussus gelatinilyticus]|uniref:Uncharacterized protein n=1 Tax=Halorussus gelatinilyticus TaxID=2937524 RepID=A0A8U0ILV1_9EURY|nr:hypothetical protein [Halorussus gelatinilyticus]UPW01666.1 hypothetical protein M0R88_06080 [Halorussus gelatinilyticus]